MAIIRGSGKLYSGDREIANIVYVIHDTATGNRPFQGNISGTFHITGEMPHPLNMPGIQTPFPVIHLGDGRTLAIIITQGPRPYGDEPFRFQAMGGYSA